MSNYIGYAFTVEGKYFGKEIFNNVEIAIKWFANKGLQEKWKRVILTDIGDCCIAEIIEGKVVFPQAIVEIQENGLLEKLGSEYDESERE